MAPSGGRSGSALRPLSEVLRTYHDSSEYVGQVLMYLRLSTLGTEEPYLVVLANSTAGRTQKCSG
jgi:hypothetical protein